MPSRGHKARNVLLGFCFLSASLFPGAGGCRAEVDKSQFYIIPVNDIYADSALFYLAHFETVLSEMLGVPLDTSISVYIADSEEEFRSYAGTSLPDWGAGAASPERGIIVIKSPKFIRTGKSFSELLGHELTHIMLYRAAGGRWLPRWIHEGMAMRVSGEWNIGQDILVARAAWTNNLIYLQRLENLSEFNGAQANLAYTESFLAVSSLLRGGGEYIMADLLEFYRHNGDFYKSFKQATGSDYATWITEWQERTSMQYHFLLFIFDSRVLWLAVPLLIVALYLYKKKQNRGVKRKWKMEERLNPPGNEYKEYYDGYYDEENQV